jgi:hypothetical protein
MNPKKIPSRAIDRSKYIVYLNKAQDFYQAMRRSMDEENWNSAGLEAVHCAISATDALLAYAGGIRCTSQAHSDAAELVKQTIRSSEAATNSRHFLRIVNMKNLIEYEARNFTQQEAVEIAKHTERYFDWVRSLLV